MTWALGAAHITSYDCSIRWVPIVLARAITLTHLLLLVHGQGPGGNVSSLSHETLVYTEDVVAGVESQRHKVEDVLGCNWGHLSHNIIPQHADGGLIQNLERCR